MIHIYHCKKTEPIKQAQLLFAVKQTQTNQGLYHQNNNFQLNQIQTVSERQPSTNLNHLNVFSTTLIFTWKSLVY